MQIKLITNFNAITNPTATHALLQSPLWGKVQEADGRKTFYLGLFDAEENIKSSSLIIKHPLPFNKSWLYSPRLYFTFGYFAELIDAVAAIAKKERAIFWKIELAREHKGLINNCPLPAAQASPLQPAETFVINLADSPDLLLKNMKQKTRYNIKLAQKKGVKIRWSKDALDINIFYNLLTKTAKRQKIKLHPKSHYQNILQILGSKNNAALAIARFNNQPIAANLVTFFGNTATYLHGGTSSAFNYLMAPSLLQWETMLEAKRRGCRLYDLGGCAVKTDKVKQWAGITRFKSGFGGKLAQFGPTYDVIFDRKWYWVYRTAQKII